MNAYFHIIMQMEQKKIRSLTRRQAVVVSQQPKPSLHRLNSNEIHRDHFFIFVLCIHRGTALFFRIYFQLYAISLDFYFVRMTICASSAGG